MLTVLIVKLKQQGRADKSLSHPRDDEDEDGDDAGDDGDHYAGSDGDGHQEIASSNALLVI